MKTYIKKEFTVVKKIAAETFCDMCGEQFGKIIPYDERIEAIEFIYGNSYMDCDLKKGFVIEDLCASCSEKIKSILKEVGVNFKEYEPEW